MGKYCPALQDATQRRMRYHLLLNAWIGKPGEASRKYHARPLPAASKLRVMGVASGPNKRNPTAADGETTAPSLRLFWGVREFRLRLLRVVSPTPVSDRFKQQGESCRSVSGFSAQQCSPP